MSKFIFVLLVVPIACILAAVAGVVILNRPTGVVAKDIEIPPGASVEQIARQLHRERLIRDPRLLQLFAYLKGSGRKLMAGVHPFSGHMTTYGVLLELERPRDAAVSVTIPEGLRKEKIAAILADKLDLDRQKLLALMNDAEFCKTLFVPTDDLEGYLFPETYKFSVVASEQRVLRTMVGHFHAVFDDRLKRRARERGMSMHEVVTLASIVEGETCWDNERDTIAAVYHNRLQKGMRLQADPTVQYALPDGPRRLFYKDYDYDSPYNTYRHAGLPPGPIGSPGKASIEAALFPADVDYLFFVATGEGGHVFTRTFQEHSAAKQKTMPARKNSWGEE